jgi:hypothetical protein
MTRSCRCVHGPRSARNEYRHPGVPGTRNNGSPAASPTSDQATIRPSGRSRLRSRTPSKTASVTIGNPYKALGLRQATLLSAGLLAAQIRTFWQLIELAARVGQLGGVVAGGRGGRRRCRPRLGRREPARQVLAAARAPARSSPIWASMATFAHIGRARVLAHQRNRRVACALPFAPIRSPGSCHVWNRSSCC